MRIAVVGSGVSGLVCAYHLSREHEVTLFEAADYLGGHTHTHDVEMLGRHYRVDSGFIVFNPVNYPLLTALFEELGVISQPTHMSFSVRSEASGLEYNATSLDTLFCQRRNLVSWRFLGMVRDLMRFYRESPTLLSMPPGTVGPTLGEYLREGGYGAAFRDEHLIPMASALWSSPAQQVLAFPARYLVQFMANHQMLQVSDRPQWRVVSGGSASYVTAMRLRWQVHERLSCPVTHVRREADHVEIQVQGESERFDHAVLACHSDQALALLLDADTHERDILGAIHYQANDAVLHTDASLLPANRKAWAAWNAHVGRNPGDPCTVSYCMNILQGIQSPQPFVVTLNRTDAIDPDAILRRMHYEHPIYSHASVAAQSRKPDIQGRRRTWFAGAYWGWGFHEDGVRSAMEIVQALRAPPAAVLGAPTGRHRGPAEAPEAATESLQATA